MRLEISELMRLLDYVPKETAADLHQKILGKLVVLRHFEATYMSRKYDEELGRRDAKYKREEEFIESLSDEELTAWAALRATYRGIEDPEPLEGE